MESSCHYFNTPEEPVVFKKLRIASGEYFDIENEEQFSQISSKYISVNQFETCFPPVDIIENQHVKGVINHFFPNGSNSKKALIGYSYINHLKVFGFTEKDLGSFSTFGDHDDAILCWDQQRNLIVYIRVCKENDSSDNIKQEVKRCDEFIKAFLLMYEKKPIGPLSICPFVALPGIPLEDVKEKTMFVNHEQEIGIFLAQEDLADFSRFNKAIEKSHDFAKRQQKHLGIRLETNQLQEQIFAECMASMTFIKNAFLPRLTNDEYTQVLSLFLNKEQYEVIQHPNKKLIVRGPFGSGKSIILEKIVEKLVLSMQKEGANGTIYYIMCEPYSLLEARMDEVFEELAKRTDPSIKLVSTNIHELLQMAHHTTPYNKIEAVMRHCQSSDGIVHFLFDEVDASYFTKENAEGLKDFIDKSDNNTTIILSLQSTEKDQTVYGGSEKHEIETFFQDKKKTGMVLFELKKSMRMVSNVYQLKRIAEDFIKSHSTNLTLKEKPKNELLNPLAVETSQPDNNHLDSFDLTSPGNSSDGFEETNNSNTQESHSELSTHQIILYREDFTNDPNAQSSHGLEIKCNYPECENGVSIVGSCKPSVIYLDKEFDIKSSQATSVLSMIFKEDCFISSSKKTTIICNEWSEAVLTLFTLKDNLDYIEYIPFLLNNRIPSKDEKKAVWEKCNSRLHLVTDFQAFRGCETEVCVMFINPDESFIRHILLEVLARAVVNLVVIVLPSKSNERNRGMEGHFGQILEEWEKQKRVDIDVYKIDDTGNNYLLEKGENKFTTPKSFDNGINDSFEKFKIEMEEKKGEFHSKPER